MKIVSNISLIDEELEKWKSTIGHDFDGYKNHVYRMVNFCLALKKCNPEEQEKIIIAGCFHDIGIWIENTLDYIPPSIPPMTKYLLENNLEEWSEEITLMIEEHHKIRKYSNSTYPLVELFRKGDLVDFSLGLVKFGLSKEYIKEVKNTFPNAGFHKGLIKKLAAWFIRHPSSPAPMMKW